MPDYIEMTKLITALFDNEDAISAHFVPAT